MTRWFFQYQDQLEINLQFLYVAILMIQSKVYQKTVLSIFNYVNLEQSNYLTLKIKKIFAIVNNYYFFIIENVGKRRPRVTMWRSFRLRCQKDGIEQSKDNTK